MAKLSDRIVGDPRTVTANRNYIINGGFDIWQRGTNFPSLSSVYSADRWLSPANSTAIRSGDVPSSEFAFSNLVDRTGGAAALRGSVELNESGVASPFDTSGVYTFSAWVKAEAADNFKLRVDYADNVSSITNNVEVLANQVIAAVTTEWTQIEFTIPIGGAVPVGTNNAIVLLMAMETSDVSFRITGIKLEAGLNATAFTTQGSSIGDELALCQRYYEKSYNTAGFAGSITNTGRVASTITSTASIRWDNMINFRTTKRANPSVKLYSPSSGAEGVFDVNAVDLAAAVQNIGVGGGRARLNAGHVGSTVDAYTFHWTADAEL